MSDVGNLISKIAFDGHRTRVPSGDVFLVTLNVVGEYCPPLLLVIFTDDTSSTPWMDFKILYISLL